MVGRWWELQNIIDETKVKIQCNYESNRCQLTIYSSTILNNCKLICNGRRCEPLSRSRTEIAKYIREHIGLKYYSKPEKPWIKVAVVWPGPGTLERNDMYFQLSYYIMHRYCH